MQIVGCTPVEPLSMYSTIAPFKDSKVTRFFKMNTSLIKMNCGYTSEHIQK